MPSWAGRPRRSRCIWPTSGDSCATQRCTRGLVTVWSTAGNRRLLLRLVICNLRAKFGIMNIFLFLEDYFLRCQSYEIMSIDTYLSTWVLDINSLNKLQSISLSIPLQLWYLLGLSQFKRERHRERETLLRTYDPLPVTHLHQDQWMVFHINSSTDWKWKGNQRRAKLLGTTQEQLPYLW